MNADIRKQTDPLVRVESHGLLGGSLDKCLQAWRPLELKRRVRLCCKWRQGQVGTVEEINSPGDITGMARYGVRLDHGHALADVCRFELAALKRNGKPDYEA